MIISVIVWLLRLVVGGTFVFSGFAKVVDPWGFMYKLQEYFAVWGIDWMPREALFCMCTLMALIEFTAGAMLMLGCMRRVSVWVIAAMMAVMLPLTIYIYLFSPVDDCGCFGDALLLSNKATMIKNIVLTIFIIFLIKWNTWTDGLVIPLLQWIPATACALYCIVLSLFGLLVQPVVDFRPYKVGTPLLASPSHDEGLKLMYKRGDDVREFGIDELPDSTWEYVGRVAMPHVDKHAFTIYDGDEDVTEDVIAEDGPQVILTVSNPRYHNRARASMANRIYEYMQLTDGQMIGVVAIPSSRLDEWKELASPDYPVYTADDVAIKELVRGDASLIYLVDGIIKWKYDIYALPGDFPDLDATDNEMESLKPVDDGSLIKHITLILAIVFASSWLLSLPSVVKWRIERRKRRKAKLDAPT